jgi:hypothetical protein
MKTLAITFFMCLISSLPVLSQVLVGDNGYKQVETTKKYN